jgi:hypothetical protein
MNKIIAVKKLTNFSVILCVVLSFITFSAYCGDGQFEYEYLEINSAPFYLSYAVILLTIFALVSIIVYKDYVIGERRKFIIALKKTFFQILVFSFVIAFIACLLYSFIMAPLWMTLSLLFVFVLIIVYLLNCIILNKEDKKEENVETN